MNIAKLAVIFCLLLSVAYAKKEEPPKVATNESEITASINEKKSQLKEIDSKIGKSIWLKRYNDFQSYKKLSEEQDGLKSKLARFKRGEGGEDEIVAVQKKLEALKKQLAIYGTSKNSMFGELTKVDEVASPKSIDNPLLIFSAISSIRDLDDKKSLYENRISEIDNIISQLKSKKSLLIDIDTNSSKIKGLDSSEQEELRQSEIQHISSQLQDIKNERDDFETTVSIFAQKSSEVIQRLKFEIQEQLLKLMNIGIIVVGFFILSFLLKLSVKKYINQNHEKSYILNKIIGITTYVLIALTLLLSYMQNVAYLVTILGFASAGIAIAMKDWFMSLLGWFTIVSSGIVKVGDRVKFSNKDSGEVLGDVLDISPLKITLYEDVSLLSYEKHKRAGRIVFIPNNYVFSHIVLNYSHDGLQTVWDSVTIVLTFDSNIEKATQLINEVVIKHTKTFSRLTERQTNKLRTKYSIRAYSVEPRIFTFIEGYGMAISAWFLTHSFSILSIKSTISKDILDTIQAQNDIRLAYPTSTIGFSEIAKKEEQERLKGE